MKTALLFVLGITLSSTLFSQDTGNPNEPRVGQVVPDVGSAENELEALKYLNAKIYEFVLQQDIYLVDPASGETVGFLKAGCVLVSPSAVDLRDTDLGNSERLKLLIKVSDAPEVPILIMRETQEKPMVYDARKEINRTEDKATEVR